jgi:hypothetical protein
MTWLHELELENVQRVGKGAIAVTGNMDGSFDPVTHGLDESDPQFQTRTVI